VRVFLTGGSGYLGRRIVERLGPQHELVALCLDEGEVSALQGYPVAETLQGNVLDPESLQPLVAGCDAGIHAAGGVNHDPAEARFTWEVHVRGTEHVLDAAAQAGVRRVVHVSSSGTIAISEDADHIANEGAARPHGLAKDLPYYRAKLYAEDAALERNAEGFEVVIVNPALLLGPGDTLGVSTRPVWTFLEYGLPAVPPGGLSFVDVRDAAEGIALALERGEAGRRYLLGGANMTFEAFYQRLARIADQAEPALRMPRFTRRMLGWFPDVGREGFPLAAHVDRFDIDLACLYWYVDSRRARAELGWSSRDPLQTLEDTVAFAQGRGDW